MTDTITIEWCSRSAPAHWWHRPVLWFTRNNAGFTVCIPHPSGPLGHAYTYDDVDSMADATLHHEAQHVAQAVSMGWWTFVRRYLLSSRWRLRLEAEAYWISSRVLFRKGDTAWVHNKLRTVRRAYHMPYDPDVVDCALALMVVAPNRRVKLIRRPLNGVPHV